MNALDKPGEQFDFAMFNVRPSARKRKGEPFYTVTAEIDKDMWQQLMDANIEGAIFAGRLFRSTDGEAEPETPNAPKKHEHGDVARAMVAHGVFQAPEVLRALGTDKEFREWITTQHSCLSKTFDHEGDREYTIACHVRRAANAGTGMKPAFSCVPMTNAEHQLQHQHGEAQLLNRHGHALDAEQAKEWFNKRAALYRNEWGRMRLAKLFGAASLGDIPPTRIADWAKEHDLMRFMPREVRGD